MNFSRYSLSSYTNLEVLEPGPVDKTVKFSEVEYGETQELLS